VLARKWGQGMNQGGKLGGPSAGGKKKKNIWKGRKRKWGDERFRQKGNINDTHKPVGRSRKRQDE